MTLHFWSGCYRLQESRVWHQNLRLLDKELAYKEIINSKKELEQLTGKEVKYMAFPYDGYNRTILNLALNAGYRRVFSGYATLCSRVMDDFFYGRIDVTADDWMIEFKLKIAGAYNWMHPAVNCKR